MHASSSSSRPFLNLLNPMGRHYRGYMPVSRDRVLEQDEDDEKRTPRRAAGKAKEKAKETIGKVGRVMKRVVSMTSLRKGSSGTQSPISTTPTSAGVMKRFKRGVSEPPTSGGP